MKFISKQMHGESLMAKLVTIIGVMLAVNVLFYITYSIIFFLTTVLGLGSIVVGSLIGALIIVVAMVKHPKVKKVEYSDFTKKYL